VRSATRVVGYSAALLLMLTGCGSGSSLDGPQLVTPGTPHDVAVGMGKVKPGAETTFGSMIMCLDRQGQITVTGARPVDAQGGIRIDQFGLRPSPFWRGGGTGIGVQYGDLSANGFQVGRTVDLTCNHHGRGYELAVTVSMPDSTEARMSGVEITYTSDGQQETVTYPLTIFLCPHKIRGSRTCAADDAA
jgi:hypothetical protein